LGVGGGGGRAIDLQKFTNPLTLGLDEVER